MKHYLLLIAVIGSTASSCYSKRLILQADAVSMTRLNAENSKQLKIAGDVNETWCIKTDPSSVPGQEREGQVGLADQVTSLLMRAFGSIPTGAQFSLVNAPSFSSRCPVKYEHGPGSGVDGAPVPGVLKPMDPSRIEIFWRIPAVQCQFADPVSFAFHAFLHGLE